MGNSYAGLTAIVTGAGSGIGLAVAKALYSEGVTVFGLDIDEGAMAPYAKFVSCDIGVDEKVTRAFVEIANATEVIDIVANNAGVGATGSIEEATAEDWQRVFNINVFGIARVSNAALPFLRKSKWPAIVNTCSIAATAGLPRRAVYGASKGAVMSLTLAMAADFVKEGIRVNCVNPGTADTPWVDRILGAADDPVSERKALEDRQPMGRLVYADEVASAILYLANPKQASTTGTILAVDGGMQGLRLPK